VESTFAMIKAHIRGLRADMESYERLRNDARITAELRAFVGELEKRIEELTAELGRRKSLPVGPGSRTS